jgi:carboxylesterase type B
MYHWILSDLLGDAYFTCPTQRLIKSLSKQQNVYAYVFNYTNAPNGVLKAHHASDLMYAFGFDGTNGLGITTELEWNFANDIVKYFATFVKTGKHEYY